MPHPGSVRCNPNRERRENRESLYDLFLFVCTLRVVRGSWNSKGVSVVIFTVKWAKTANKKGSASGSLSSTLRKVCRKGSALNPGQQECFLSLPSYHRWLRKTCESLYWFASPCSRSSRCSRFMFLNGVSPVDLKRFKVESKEKVSPPLQGGNQEPLRKKRPLFVPFPLFAVHGIYRECPL